MTFIPKNNDHDVIVRNNNKEILLHWHKNVVSEDGTGQWKSVMESHIESSKGE